MQSQLLLDLTSKPVRDLDRQDGHFLRKTLLMVYTENQSFCWTTLFCASKLTVLYLFRVESV
jgi:hypothetical protein